MSGRVNGTHQDLDPDQQRQRVRAVIAGMLGGSGLRVQEGPHGLEISNERLPELGVIHVEFGDGYVSWGRKAWDHWGHLPGFGDVSEGVVTADQIREALRVRT